MKSASTAILLTCEHGGNQVPAALKFHFRINERFVASHRGWDLGALAVAQNLQKRFKAPLIAARTSRLVVDLNRSQKHPRVFSDFTRGLPKAERASLLERYHSPYREKVLSTAKALLEKSQTVVHLSVHSFTAQLDGSTRRCDLGLLYDPSHAREKDLAQRIKSQLKLIWPSFKVRMNYPYRGSTDGLTTTLRSILPERRYQGLEIEINQRHLVSKTYPLRLNAKQLEKISSALAIAVSRALNSSQI